jgi:hypothetical protein
MRKKLIFFLAAACVFSFNAQTADFIYLTEKIGSYTQVEPPVVYTQKDLYEYINGQAVFYFSYGFTRLEHGYYSRGDTTYYVDVYELGSDLSAFGAFRQQREEDAAPLKIGAEGAQTDYLTVFWKGNRYVEIIPMSSGDPDLSGMQFIAREIDKKIKASLTLPKELSLLPGNTLKKGSERYVDENLMSYSFMGRGLTGVYSSPDGAGDFRVFISMAENESVSGKIFSEYSGKLEEQTKVKIGNKEGLKGKEPYRGTTIIAREGRFMYGAVDVKNEKAALGILEQVQQNLLKSK